MSNKEQADFNNLLKHMSKVYLKVLLENIGLKSKYEKVLYLFYIDELSYSEIAEKLNMTKESIGNLITKARKEFYFLYKCCAVDNNRSDILSKFKL